MPSGRAILLAGFGGLLLLIAFAGADALLAVQRIQARSAEIQQGFLERSRALDQIRSDVYLAGTYARDYLTDPEAENAGGYRAELNRLRTEMDQALDVYARLIGPADLAPLEDLRARLSEYWRVLDPVFEWTAEQRRGRGFAFMRDEILPRRAAMLELAGQIEIVNERQVSAGNQRVAELFAGFRERLALVMAGTLGLGLLLAGFSVQRVLHLERQASARYREVQDLSARLVEAQEEERRALSRELHDEVGQTLSAVLVGLSNLTAAIQSGNRAEMDAEASVVRKLAETSVAEVRNIALLLRPSMLDDLGLVPALEWQAREMSRRHNLVVNVSAEDVPEDLPEDYKTCIYRVVQEALHNVARHAGAKSASIVLTARSALRLTIEDDGHGFDPQRHRGLGLLGMQERVEHLRGRFHAGSRPAGGTRIEISLPLPVTSA
jgi:signal transduction histidine kinase